MTTVVSFEADAVQPEELSGVLVDYLALERLRIFRRLLVERFAILAAIVALSGFLWLSTIAACTAVGMCLTPPIWVWALEIRCERRLARTLDAIPGRRTDPAHHHPTEEPSQKVIKSS
jgi:hypothetical protein